VKIYCNFWIEAGEYYGHKTAICVSDPVEHAAVDLESLLRKGWRVHSWQIEPLFLAKVRQVFLLEKEILDD
jgi:hypothetical protein